MVFNNKTDQNHNKVLICIINSLSNPIVAILVPDKYHSAVTTLGSQWPPCCQFRCLSWQPPFILCLRPLKPPNNSRASKSSPAACQKVMILT